MVERSLEFLHSFLLTQPAGDDRIKLEFSRRYNKQAVCSGAISVRIGLPAALLGLQRETVCSVLSTLAQNLGKENEVCFRIYLDKMFYFDTLTFSVVLVPDNYLARADNIWSGTR